MCPRSGVPSSQALPGFLITGTPPVCVSDVIGALVVWRKNNNNNKNRKQRFGMHGFCEAWKMGAHLVDSTARTLDTCA